MEKIDWKYEIISTIFLFIVITLILPLFHVDDHVIWLAGIIVGIGACMLVGIKIYIFKLKMDLKDNMEELMENFSDKAGSMINPMFKKYSLMKEPEFSYAKKIINDTAQQIEEIAKGIIYLTDSEYFDEIISEVEKMSQNEVIWAVNAFDEKRFIHDPREKIYFEKNREAVCNRKVIIKRIFIYDDLQQNMDVRKERLSAIKMNFDTGIDVFVVYKSRIKEQKNANELCNDAVMFGHHCPRLYIDYPDRLDEIRVSYGELRINEIDIEQFKKNFNTLTHMAISKEDVINLLKGI